MLQQRGSGSIGSIQPIGYMKIYRAFIWQMANTLQPMASKDAAPACTSMSRLLVGRLIAANYIPAMNMQS